jgi:hypothetical protein
MKKATCIIVTFVKDVQGPVGASSPPSSPPQKKNNLVLKRTVISSYFLFSYWIRIYSRSAEPVEGWSSPNPDPDPLVQFHCN